MNGLIAKPFNVDEMMETLQQLTGCKAEPEPVRVEEAPPVPASMAPPEVLDAAAGLRTWGDEEAYKKYLRRFASADGRCGPQLAALLEQDRRSEASAITHRLKGSSGALALVQVERASRLLDDRLAGGGDLENLLETFQLALDAALNTILLFAGSSAENASASRNAAASDAVAPLLTELLRALDRDNPDAAESILASMAKEVPEEMFVLSCWRLRWTRGSGYGISMSARWPAGVCEDRE